MAALAGVSSAMLLAAPSYATTFTVTNGGNAGAGSLRNAIGQAETNNNDPTVDVIQFNPAVTTVDLEGSQISIDHPVTIGGPGADQLTVRRSPAATTDFRVFVVSPSATQTVTIEGMTISRGNVQGAAVFKADAGSLLLDSVWLTDNQITATGSGGGVHCDGGSLSVRNSTVSGNQAGFAGGISVNRNIGAMTACVASVINSTISGNSAREFGGGVYVGGTGQVTINSSTIQGNAADSDNTGGGGGGGTYNASGMAATIAVANTLYAGNTVGSSGTLTTTQCGGIHTSSGYNLRTVSETGCSFNGTGEVVNANPMIGTLGDHGGPTPTIPLLNGSPALEAGNPTTPADDAFPACPTTDQRRVSRLGGGNRCDIGAFEKRSPTATAVECSPASLTLGTGASICTATVTDLSDAESPSGDVTFTSSGTGTFSNVGICTLAVVGGTSASCSVTYTPTAVGTGGHLITGSYAGTLDWTASAGSDEIAVAAAPQLIPATPVPGGTPFNLKAAIKKCKKKFPKGKKRKKCIKRAKKRASHLISAPLAT